MARTYVYIFVALALISCGKKSHRKKEDTLSSAFSEVNFDVNPKIYGFNEKQEAKIHKAIELIKKIVISEEFKNKILTKEYKGKKRFVDNKGLSNLQIYNKILEASEKFNPEKNNCMDLELELIFENSKIIGYTYPTVNRIFINRKYFQKFTPAQVADNLFHEWLHKIGFDHDLKHSADRTHSVPYAIGYMIKDLAQRVTILE
jgi:hypothetical protein